MARTEKVIMKNMCMVFSENRVLVQDKTDGGTRYIVLYTQISLKECYFCLKKGCILSDIDEMKQRKLAYGMDKMLEVFLNDNISEYFFEENGKMDRRAGNSLNKCKGVFKWIFYLRIDHFVFSYRVGGILKHNG